MSRDVFLVIVVLIASAVSAGYIADKKGHSYNGFALLGLVLPIIGPIIAAVMPNKNEGNAQELVNYKKLLDEGIISQEEFEKKKRELIG